jgi:hypothetical protein
MSWSQRLVWSPLAGMVLPFVLRTGRCYLRLERESNELIPLVWDEAALGNSGLRCAGATEKDGWWPTLSTGEKSAWIWPARY